MKITRLFLLMLMFTVSAMAVQSGGGRLESTQGGEESIGGSNSTTCVWYDIYCNDGSTDECCGDSGSCLSYCENVCGGRCIET